MLRDQPDRLASLDVPLCFFSPDGRDVKAPNPVRVSKASGQFLAMKKRKKLLRADKH